MFNSITIPEPPRKISVNNFYCTIGQEFEIKLNSRKVIKIKVDSIDIDEDAFKKGIVRYMIFVKVVDSILELSPFMWKELINGYLIEHDISKKIE